MQQPTTPSVVELTAQEMIKTSGGADPVTNFIKLLLGGGGAVPIEPTPGGVVME